MEASERPSKQKPKQLEEMPSLRRLVGSSFLAQGLVFSHATQKLQRGISPREASRMALAERQKAENVRSGVLVTHSCTET